mmetsp:Transcript_27406/g.87103  ORF Transcript_27406/g.87103 Transcript_27406/m.87103 type:complete len:283 (-) Transcript_27406:385-1233(-)
MQARHAQLGSRAWSQPEPLQGLRHGSELVGRAPDRSCGRQPSGVPEDVGHVSRLNHGVVAAVQAHDARLHAGAVQPIHEALGEGPPVSLARRDAVEHGPLAEGVGLEGEPVQQRWRGHGWGTRGVMEAHDHPVFTLQEELADGDRGQASVRPVGEVPDVEWRPRLQNVVRQDHGPVGQQAETLKELKVGVKARALLIHEDHAKGLRSVGVEEMRNNVVAVPRPNVHGVGHAGILHHVPHNRDVDRVNLDAHDTAAVWAHGPREVHGGVANVSPYLQDKLRAS